MCIQSAKFKSRYFFCSGGTIFLFFRLRNVFLKLSTKVSSRCVVSNCI
uniref:Uncharacterized protein n=1 Tax=Ciona intestinalis TaxID=7719 RepID=H2XQY7_CIOIN